MEAPPYTVNTAPHWPPNIAPSRISLWHGPQARRIGVGRAVTASRGAAAVGVALESRRPPQSKVTGDVMAKQA